jgi:hypothetical protein
MTDFYQSDPDLVLYYQDQLNNLCNLNLDPVHDLLVDCYSSTGAPARLAATPILRAMAGYAHGDKIHPVGSYDDLINRIGCADPALEHEFEHALHPFRRKPSNEIRQNENQPIQRPGIVQKLADLATQGRSFENRPKRLMQQIFAKVGTEPAARQGLLSDTRNLAVSGDGTCVLSGGSGRGSYHGNSFYGHSEYILSVCNPDLKCDWPPLPASLPGQPARPCGQYCFPG